MAGFGSEDLVSRIWQPGSDDGWLAAWGLAVICIAIFVGSALQLVFALQFVFALALWHFSGFGNLFCSAELADW